MKEHMGEINTDYTNWIGIPVTKQCLNKMAGHFSSLMEMSSHGSPSGNNATNNYRKLTLYLNSQMRGKSSRHLISQMNTKILICNDLEQCIGKLCSLKQHSNMCTCRWSSSGTTDLDGVYQEGLLKVDFTLFKVCEVVGWGWRRVKFGVVRSAPFCGGFRPQRSQLIFFPSSSPSTPCSHSL